MKFYLTRFYLLTAFVILLLSVIFVVYLVKKSTVPLSQTYLEKKYAREDSVFQKIDFQLKDPTQAPKPLREIVEKGFRLMIDTKIEAPEYVGNDLQCTNCHFAAGDTIGGFSGGLPLAGVASQYPRYDARFGKVINLETRINSCFQRSLNGKALPVESEEMLSLVTYLHWISKDTPIYSKVPWLSMTPVKTTFPPNPEHGEKLYQNYCAICHREDGQGGENNPPVWGERSYNMDAGFGNLEMLSAFIYYNMPYMDNLPVLSQQEAVDVASYVLKQHEMATKKDNKDTN